MRKIFISIFILLVINLIINNCADRAVFDEIKDICPMIIPEDNATIYNGTPKFEWGKVKGANSYELYINNKLITRTMENMYTLSSEEALTDGEYYWKVRSINEYQYMPCGEKIFKIVIPTSAELLTNDGFCFSTDRPTLEWKNSDGIKHNVIEISINSDFSNILMVYNTSDSKIELSVLEDGLYYWRVISTDVNGNVHTSTTNTFIVNTTVIEKPILNTLTQNNSQPLDFTWAGDVLELPYSYEFNISSDDFSNILFSKTDILNTSYTLTEEDYTLVLGNTYNWRVRINYYDCVGEWSEIQTFNYLANEECINVTTPVISVTGTDYTEEVKDIQWDSVANATEYQISIDYNNGTNTINIVTETLASSTTNYSFTPANNGDYTIKIIAKNDCSSLFDEETKNYYKPPIMCNSKVCNVTTCDNPIANSITMPFGEDMTYPNAVKSSANGDFYAFPYSGVNTRHFVHYYNNTLVKHDIFNAVECGVGLSVDSQRNAHIIYYTHDSVNYLFYDNQTQSYTQEIIQTPFINMGYGSGDAWLAIDSNDIPHVVFGGLNPNALFYATKDSSNNWIITHLASETVYHHTMVLDSNNKILIAYFDSSYKLMLIKGKDGIFSSPVEIPIIPFTINGYFGYIRGLNILRSCDNTLYLILGGFAGSSEIFIYKSIDNGDSWNLTFNNSSLNFWHGMGCDADQDGNIYMSFGIGSSGQVCGYLEIYKLDVLTNTFSLFSSQPSIPGCDPMLSVNCAGYPMLVSNDNILTYFSCD